MKLIVVIDGDLLVTEDPDQGMQGQKDAISQIVRRLGVLLDNGHELVIVHGNAPQVGYMLLRGEAARHVVHSLPLDICGADTQGATGYMLQQAISNWLHQHEIEKEIVTLITQVEVNGADLISPPYTKGIGPYFNWERVQADQHNRGWEFKLFPGLGYQRVVPGLMPKKVIEATHVRHILERGVIVICAGGGGIPVRSDENGDLIGVDAVVDKAYTCVLLAAEIDCDLIIFVSPRDRIVGSYDLNLTNGLQEIDLKKIDTLINRYEMEDTMRHKLIASKQFLQQGGNKTVLILPPDQLGADPSSCCGVQLGSEAYVTSFRSQ
ncbi:MAG: hypothetical protein WBD56_10440 [Anaerolineales bacterium]